MKLEFELTPNETTSGIRIYNIERKGIIVGLLILENPYNQKGTEMKEMILNESMGHKRRSRKRTENNNADKHNTRR